MLYLHCGLPRTSTSSLQAVLFKRRDQLAASGMVYPDRWRSHLGPTHHGLSELLKASQESAAAFDDLKLFLKVHADRDVLFSAESLTFWLSPDKKLSALLRFLATAQEVMPARCVWTLRRLDDILTSLYLWRTVLGIKLPSPVEFVGTIFEPNAQFAGLQMVEECVGGDAIYVKYDSAGTHNGDLLRALGVPGAVGDVIQKDLKLGPRLNASLSHKQAVVLLNLDALSARAGSDLDKQVLHWDFYRRRFGFEEDWPCEVVDEGAKKALHERALAAGQKQGFAPYAEFFGDARISGPPSVSLGLEALTDEDLNRLVAHLRQE